MIYELIARNTGMKSLMGNSITTSFYYCEDNSYTLSDNKCIKSETTTANILGDVNLDGVVDNNDLDLLNKYDEKVVKEIDELIGDYRGFFFTKTIYKVKKNE